MSSNTDRIEKQIVIQAPPARVWRALTNSKEFGQWFGVALDGEFIPGQSIQGQITDTGCDHVLFEIHIKSMRQEQLFSYRWNPLGVDKPSEDPSAEPSTLVEFKLQAVEGGTQLDVIESGFDSLPPERREQSSRQNDGGWKKQMQRVHDHVMNNPSTASNVQ